MWATKTLFRVSDRQWPNWELGLGLDPTVDSAWSCGFTSTLKEDKTIHSLVGKGLSIDILQTFRSRNFISSIQYTINTTSNT